eukprot:TRINITY_DN38640_c0_g2_i2.p1 TRINITY_DN38640_c0_g2~~TRINITY_DN38640_c0_g2_i2.p1  ORF type:complete len:212 (-),score=48.53 TRINITY_DN38640_c0_g2_i2:94-729(-)
MAHMPRTMTKTQMDPFASGFEGLSPSELDKVCFALLPHSAGCIANAMNIADAMNIAKKQLPLHVTGSGASTRSPCTSCSTSSDQDSEDPCASCDVGRGLGERRGEQMSNVLSKTRAEEAAKERHPKDVFNQLLEVSKLGDLLQKDLVALETRSSATSNHQIHAKLIQLGNTFEMLNQRMTLAVHATIAARLRTAASICAANAGLLLAEATR